VKHRHPELQLVPAAILRSLDGFPLYMLAGIVFAFIVGLTLGPHLSAAVQDVGDRTGLTVLLDDPPPVEPLVLQQVSKEVAKASNDQTPFTTKPIPAADPYFFRGALEDRERAADCLAATIFYEAGNESVNGQMAVAQVVLNRVRHPAYPKSVCGVVFQGHERHTGCQFSYTCDGAMARTPSEAAWQQYRALADGMLNGLVYAPVGWATHYHTDWVLPVWSARLEKLRAEGTHLFFRFAGAWGSPRVFSAARIPAEVRFAKMSRLSVAHGGSQNDLAFAEAAAAQMAEAVANLDHDRIAETLEANDPTKDTFIIYVDPLLDPPMLTRMARDACGARRKCKVLAWADVALMPRGLPIEPADRKSMAFSYIQSGSAGSGASRWNCALFPRERISDCLPGTAASLGAVAG
jgi:Cell Wall Hydrolase